MHVLRKICQPVRAAMCVVTTGFLSAMPALADTPATGLASGGLAAGDIASATMRMVIGLAVVLGLLAATAWVSKRFRAGSGSRGGAIEILTGLSLGNRERVVLLKVGNDQVLVGISPSGLRTL
ncbi:MAG: flagellar biosynthetic protein FliO, partial [Gammaproteobacteria bacterium]|nr:flagellar biosynthetic protein FliO [Gammaproteobacteria bacterium]